MLIISLSLQLCVKDFSYKTVCWEQHSIYSDNRREVLQAAHVKPQKKLKKPGN